MFATEYSYQTILLDSHVHIYDCFDLNQFFNSALRNFQQYAANHHSCIFALLLTESTIESYFEFLSQVAKRQANVDLLPSHWTVAITEEHTALYAYNTSGQGIFLLAGSQIITAEKLEVLALFTTQRFVDGRPLATVIQDVVISEGIPVIPWGFGKWMGKRGRTLAHWLAQDTLPLLFLGDNGGRPIFWPEPYLFKRAKQKGLQILPGTDPLPFADEANRAGSFGCLLEGQFNSSRPATSIQQILLKSNVQLKPYGVLEQPWKFVRNQIGMQLLKRYKSNL
jgi:hypothetical protein